LAALVANLDEADQLIILTDQDGLFDKDPRSASDAELIAIDRSNNPRLLEVASPVSGQLGRGGMFTKVKAASLAARSGACTIIANGHEPSLLMRIEQGESVGSRLEPDDEPWAARKQWLAGHLQMKGVLVLDDGAIKVLRSTGSSLLSVGVVDVVGEFQRGEMVACHSLSGERVACGLVNYSQSEALKIKGVPSHAISEKLGYIVEDELIHRDNMVVL